MEVRAGVDELGVRDCTNGLDSLRGWSTVGREEFEAHVGERGEGGGEREGRRGERGEGAFPELSLHSRMC